MATPFSPYLQDLANWNDCSKHSLLVRFSNLDDEEMDQFSEWSPSIPLDMENDLISFNY
jgi:hypothetical protein